MYTLTPSRRRPAAARVERDAVQVTFGTLLWLGLVALSVWMVP